MNEIDIRKWIKSLNICNICNENIVQNKHSFTFVDKKELKTLPLAPSFNYSLDFYFGSTLKNKSVLLIYCCCESYAVLFDDINNSYDYEKVRLSYKQHNIWKCDNDYVIFKQDPDKDYVYNFYERSFKSFNDAKRSIDKLKAFL